MTSGDSSTQIDALFDASLAAAQQPIWPDKAATAKAIAELRVLPPLVFAGECDNLKARIALAADGNAFWLQGGDCAETFVGATADSIRNRIKTILQMAAVLQYGASLPVIKVGRMAGQFAKPRSNDNETRDGITLPAYRGDAVNDLEFNEKSRTSDPNRMVKVYNTSSATLKLVRAFTQGGFADIRHVHEWNKVVTTEYRISNVLLQGIPLKGAIDKIEFNGKQVVVIDYKTGSVENAKENVVRNKCEKINVYCGDVDLIQNQKFGLIIANINKNVLKAHMKAYSDSLEIGGTLLLSGFFESDVEELISFSSNYDLQKQNVISKESWAVIKMIKK